MTQAGPERCGHALTYSAGPAPVGSIVASIGSVRNSVSREFRTDPAKRGDDGYDVGGFELVWIVGLQVR